MIRFINVSLMRGTKPLLESVDLTLNPGDKIGLIGANGAGKSSLFGMLRGELHADQGEIDFPAKWRMAYVAQETPPLERAALDYAIDGDVNLRRLEAELARLEGEEATTENGIAIGEIYSALADAPEPGAGADVPIGFAAAGRADQPPRPRCDHLAGRLAEEVSGHPHHHFARPRFSR